MASVIGALRVSLGLDSSQFQEGLKQSNTALAVWGKRAAIAAAGIAAAGVAAFSGFNRAADSMGELYKQASIAGLSAEQFWIASRAVDQYGVSQEKLADILKDVNDKFGDFAATGGGELKDFFDNIAPKVGLTIDSFRNLSSSDALALYVTSLEKANVSQAEMTFYMEALANDATAIVPAFRDGGAAIADMAARAKELGVALDEDIARKAKAAQGDINLISEALRLRFNQAILELGPALSQLAVALMPVVEGIAWLIEKTLLWTDVAGDFVREGVLGIVRGLDQMHRDGVAALQAFGTAFRDGLNALGTAALTAAVTIVAKLVKGLSGMAQAAIDAVTVFAAALEAGLKSLAASALQWGKDIVQGIINGVRDMAGALRDTVTQMASDTAAAVTDFFRIRSPSRLMMEYGQNIAEGLGLGIADGANGPVEAMRDMASGLSGVFKGMLMEGRSFGDSMRDMLSNLFSGWADNAWNAGWSGLMGAIGLATGGHVNRSGWAMVGERGPELVRLPTGSTVFDSNQTRMAMAPVSREAAQSVHVTVGVDPRNGSIAPYVDQHVSNRMMQADRAMPSRVNSINRDPLKR